MLISLGAAVRIVEVRTVFAHQGYSLGLRTNDDHFCLIPSLNILSLRCCERATGTFTSVYSAPGAVANRLNLMTSGGFPKQGAGLILPFFSTGIIFLEGSSSFCTGDTEQIMYRRPYSKARPSAANVVKTSFKVMSALDEFVQSSSAPEFMSAVESKVSW